MKIIIPLLTSDTQYPGLLAQKMALDKLGWTAEVVYTPFTWGAQMKDLYTWLKANRRDFTHVLYCDAWDVLCFGTPEEFMEKMAHIKRKLQLNPQLAFLGSAEKMCFPEPHKQCVYPFSISPWKYVNGGNWFAEIDYFMSLFENTHDGTINDQHWLGREFCNNYIDHTGRVALDWDCDIFQSIALEDQNDFAVGRNGRIINRVTGTQPLFFHGNGKTNMEWVHAAWGKEVPKLEGAMKEIFEKKSKL